MGARLHKPCECQHVLRVLPLALCFDHCHARVFLMSGSTEMKQEIDLSPVDMTSSEQGLLAQSSVPCLTAHWKQNSTNHGISTA